MGVTEELEAFIDLVEETLPSFFKGAKKLFLESEKLQHIRKTKFKEEPLQETIDKIENTKVRTLSRSLKICYGEQLPLF